MLRPRAAALLVLTIFSASAAVVPRVSLAQAQPRPPTDVCVEGEPCGASPLLFDNFEYVVDRPCCSAGAVFPTKGWAVKATNSGENGAYGYLYTQQDSTLGSRVLVMESRPADSPVPYGFAYGQTDYYLGMGSENGTPRIQSNVWFQFWTYATPASRFATRDKTLYPCRTYYPCQSGQWSWLFMWGSRGFEASPGPDGARFLALQGETADFRGAAEYPTNATKLFQNASATPLLAGRWYHVRLHIDVSGPQGTYEAWIRERGQNGWTKVADWRGGVTPNFSWPIPTSQRTGFALFRMPTTVNGPSNSTTYMDDFTIASSVNDLPP